MKITKFEADYIATEAGKVIARSMIALPTCTLFGDDAALRISFSIGLLESDGGAVWCLFFEQGGDWSVFLDGAELDADKLDEWMPDAVHSCVAAAREILGDAAGEDFDWFTDWADTAADTLA